MTASRWKTRLIALGFGLAVALVLLEGGARWIYAHPSPPPEEDAPSPPGMYIHDQATGFRLAPNFHYEAEQFQTNALGFRDRERASGPKPEKTIRIAVIGDSFTAGVAVSDRQHYSALLEQAIADVGKRDDSPPVEVWNLGVPHFGTEQSFAQLKQWWDRIQPDLVVLGFFQGNDAFDDSQGPGFYRVVDGQMAKSGWSPWPGSPYNARRSELNRPIFAHHFPGDYGLHRFSYAYRLILRIISSVIADDSETWPWGMEPFDYEAFGAVAWLYLNPPPPPIRGGWAITEDVLSQLAQFTESKDAPLLILSIPSRINVYDADLDRALDEGWEIGSRWGGGSRNGGRTLDLGMPRKTLRLIADRHGLRVVLLEQSLRARTSEERTYYEDDSHWTTAGHREAAIALIDAIQQTGRIAGLDAEAVKRRLRSLVPASSVEDVFEGGFRPPLGEDRPTGGLWLQGSWQETPRGNGGASKPKWDPEAFLAYEELRGDPRGGSEIIPRLVDPQVLLEVLLDPPSGWTVLDGPSARITALPAPREEVVVAQAELVLRDPFGETHIVLVIDGAGQPEIDQWLRSLGDGALGAKVPDHVLSSTSRFAVLIPSQSDHLMQRINVSRLNELESELGAKTSVPPRNETLIVGMGLSEGGPSQSVRQHLVDPADLEAALPDPPKNWEVFDTTPMYRPHKIREAVVVPQPVEVLFRNANLPGHQGAAPWTAQIKRWYRGPSGSFALVVQDTGQNELLLRMREARLEEARQNEGNSQQAGLGGGKAGHNKKLKFRRWEGAGRVGFRSCRAEQGLCRVVVPLVSDRDPQPPLARYNAILMGPTGASDEAYGELISQIRLDALP